MKAEAFNIISQKTTDSKVMPLHEFRAICEWAGEPVHDPMTPVETERFIVFLDKMYRAKRKAKGSSYGGLKGSVVPSYFGAVVRDTRVRHDGYDLFAAAPMATLMLRAARRGGAERGETVDGGEPLTLGEKNRVVERFFERANDLTLSYAERWKSFTTGVLVEFGTAFMCRIGEITENPATRATRKELGVVPEIMRGCRWKHFRFFTERHDEIEFEELRHDERRQAVRFLQVEWTLTKMDPYARGFVRALYVSGMKHCVVRFIVELARRVLACGATKETATFCDVNLAPLKDTTVRSLFRKVVVKELKLPTKKARIHKAIRGTGKTALAFAGLPKEVRNLLSRCAPDSDVGDLAYTYLDRDVVRGVQAAMQREGLESRRMIPITR